MVKESMFDYLEIKFQYTIITSESPKHTVNISIVILSINYIVTSRYFSVDVPARSRQ